MQALNEFLTTDVGLLSAGVIAFMLLMGAYYVRFFLKHMHEDEARQRQQGRG